MLYTLIILGISALLFVSGRIRSDLVAVCAALALVLTGVLSPEEALAGFSNPIVIMMAALFITCSYQSIAHNKVGRCTNQREHTTHTSCKSQGHKQTG